MSKWQLIETAPEGEFMLASDGKIFLYGYWRDGELGDHLGNSWTGITHWMPLPAPPVSQSKTT